MRLSDLLSIILLQKHSQPREHQRCPDACQAIDIFIVGAAPLALSFALSFALQLFVITISDLRTK
jgi:hypothetical protein